MKPLSEQQKKFLLQFFPENGFAGAKNIATSLIETGTCIVAGHERIWLGGIGNHIEIEPAEGSVGCSTPTRST
jgi:hypothetical protein